MQTTSSIKSITILYLGLLGGVTIAASVKEPSYSSNDSKGEKMVKAYQYGQDLLDDKDKHITKKRLMDNLDSTHYENSYLCQDYDICVDKEDLTGEAYWKLMAEAAIESLLIKERENDKSIMNAEMFGELMSDGGRGVMAHIRAAGSMTKSLLGADTYSKHLDKANGGGSKTLRRIKSERKDNFDSRKSSSSSGKDLDCSGKHKGSIRCEEELDTLDTVYDHLSTLSHRGHAALRKAEREAMDI